MWLTTGESAEQALLKKKNSKENKRRFE